VINDKLHIRRALLLFFLFTKINAALASDSLKTYSIHELGFFVSGGIASMANVPQYKEYESGSGKRISGLLKYSYSAGFNYTIHAHKLLSFTIGVSYRAFAREVSYNLKYQYHGLPQAEKSVASLQCEMLYLPVRINMHFGKKRTKAYISMGPDFSPFVMVKSDIEYESGFYQSTKSRTWLTGLMFGIGVEHRFAKRTFLRVMPTMNFIDLANPDFRSPGEFYSDFKSLYTYLVGVHVEFGFLIDKVKRKA